MHIGGVLDLDDNTRLVEHVIYDIYKVQFNLNTLVRQF